LKGTSIQHPVLIDLVSGEIRPLQWKKETSNTLEAVHVSDSIMAIADADYFDWPVLPEAPSSLDAVSKEKTVHLSWQVHGGDPQHIIIERRTNLTAERQGSWQRIAQLDATVTEYSDSKAPKGQEVSYRVRAANDAGESATSNIVRCEVSD
jgi:hypothetical protein